LLTVNIQPWSILFVPFQCVASALDLCPVAQLGLGGLFSKMHLNYYNKFQSFNMTAKAIADLSNLAINYGPHYVANHIIDAMAAGSITGLAAVVGGTAVGYAVITLADDLAWRASIMREITNLRIIYNSFGFSTSFEAFYD
jgi:hypothetical protein